MKLFDYECPKHGLFEDWGNTGESSKCPKCGQSSDQLISFGGILLKFNADFPRADRMWADWHENETRRQYADPDFYE